MASTIIVVISYLLFVAVTIQNVAGSVVKTTSGTVEGHHIKSYNGRIVTAFEGIPYGKPPVGPLRFKEPQPADPWPTTLLANTKYACIHFASMFAYYMITGTEDCLYVYVYVPKENITGNENFNVIVGIHGGAFTFGDPHLFCGPDYLMDRDVIYVSMTYRLGILGFLSTEDDIVPGNNGLKDQVLALKWIKNNIKGFGGNPNSITLIGLSAGGASVHYHYLSPMSKGLFTRGISQSGTALNSWALTKKPAESAKKLARSLNCFGESSQAMVDCLRLVDVEELLGATENFFVLLNSVPFTPFGPVIEKGEHLSFLADHPYKLLLDGKINDAPWIASNTANEGIYPGGIIAGYDALPILDKQWDTLIPSVLDYIDTVDEKDKLLTTTKLREFYMKNETLTINNVDKLINLFTDRLFLSDAEKSIRAQAQTSKSPVYFYLFDYQIEMDSIYPSTIAGIGHLDDGRMVHPILANPTRLTINDERMKDEFLDFLYNFGNYDGKLKFGTTEWKPVESPSEDIYQLRIMGPDKVRMESVKELAPTEFWNRLPIKENDALYRV